MVVWFALMGVSFREFFGVNSLWYNNIIADRGTTLTERYCCEGRNCGRYKTHGELLCNFLNWQQMLACRIRLKGHSNFFRTSGKCITLTPAVHGAHKAAFMRFSGGQRIVGVLFSPPVDRQLSRNPKLRFYSHLLKVILCLMDFTHSYSTLSGDSGSLGSFLWVNPTSLSRNFALCLKCLDFAGNY